MSTVKPKFIYAQTDESDCTNLLYLCVVIDLFARSVISYSVSTNTDLTVAAVRLAYKNREYPKWILFHSDRGYQYTSRDFRNIMDTFGFVQSFSAKAHPYDNAVAESFFKFLKHEETNRQTYYSLNELNLSLFEYVHFYNNSRPHSHNNFLAPAIMETLFYDKLT